MGFLLSSTDATGGSALDRIICTAELDRRPSRLPDYQNENRALLTLARALADAPASILQTLSDTILEALQVGSAGISLLTEDAQRFYWPAISGAWQPHIGGGTPREFGPCGVVLDRNAPQMFTHVEKYYTYFQPVVPPVEECLLVPFFLKGEAVGTVWAIAHDEGRKFDSEDLRQLQSIGIFASSAYQSVLATGFLERQQESLRDADRFKDEFLATLAHELRNPLAPISNALHLLQLSKSDDKYVRTASDMMERQVKQMVRLVDDLLDVSRISRGTIRLRTECIELASTLHHVVDAAAAACESKGIKLTVTLPPNPVYVDADPTRLAQMVGNLLNNAVKFNQQGGKVWLSAGTENDQAVITVRDDGIGIANDDLGRIFDMYGQVDTALERTQGGLGIGLTLVRRLVEMHGGTVEVESDGLGKGSEFVVRLPLASALASPPPEPRINASSSTSRRILVVDDNHDAAYSLSVLLEMSGHETRLAYDGLEAVETAEAFKPELVLLDIGLPKLNGYEVAKRVRDQAWGKGITLVALTGWGQDEDRRKTLEAGFDCHVVKPVNYAALTDILAELPPAVT